MRVHKIKSKISSPSRRHLPPASTMSSTPQESRTGQSQGTKPTQSQNEDIQLNIDPTITQQIQLKINGATVEIRTGDAVANTSPTFLRGYNGVNGNLRACVFIRISEITKILKVFLIVAALIWVIVTLNQRIQDYQYKQIFTESVGKLTSDALSGFSYPSQQFRSAQGASPSSSTPIS